MKGSLPAPDGLSANDRTIGLSIAEGGDSLLYYNDNVEPDDVWRLDPWTGAVQSIETPAFFGPAYEGLSAGSDRRGTPVAYYANPLRSIDSQLGYVTPGQIHVDAAAVGVAPFGSLGGDDTGRQFGLSRDGGIYEYDPVTPNSLINAFAAPVPRIQGMAFDGTNLYVSDEASGLFTLDPDRGTVLNFVNVTGGPLFGLGASARSQLGDIHGTKWQDVDGDGTRDPGDDGLSGWTIVVQGSDQLFAGVGNGSPVSPGGLLLVDENTGAGTLVGDPVTPAGLSGVAFNSSGQLFGSTVEGSATDSRLVQIDPNTGTLIADIGPIVVGTAPLKIADLAIQPRSDVLFGIRASTGSVPAGGQLYTIDPKTARATFVGDTGSAVGGALAFAPNGTLYYSANNFHTLDPSSARILSTVPLTTSDISDGLGVRPSDGTVFGTRFGQAGEDIIIIDPNSGASTFVGSTGAGRISDLDFRRGISRQETTNANGEWWATGLPPNTYTASERLQFGWVQTAPLASESFGFEDLKLGTRLTVGNSFTTVGTLGRVVKVTGSDFIFGNGNPFPGGFSDVENGGLAGGTGNELEVNNINLNFDFGSGVEGVTLKFGEFGGNLNLNINGDFRNFQNFDELNGKVVGGALVTTTGGSGQGRGTLNVDGPIGSFAVGGQELWIDMPEILIPPVGNTGVHVVDLGGGDVVTGIDFGNERIIAVEIDQFDDTRALIGLDIVGVGMRSAILSGPAEVHVIFEGPNEGDASDDDGDGLQLLRRLLRDRAASTGPDAAQPGGVAPGGHDRSQAAGERHALPEASGPDRSVRSERYVRGPTRLGAAHAGPDRSGCLRRDKGPDRP